MELLALLTLLTLVVFGFVGFGILQRFLRSQSVGRRREMIHKERMAAMEKGLPIDSLGSDQDLVMENGASGQNQEKVLVWVRLVALCLGLFFSSGRNRYVSRISFRSFPGSKYDLDCRIHSGPGRDWLASLRGFKSWFQIQPVTGIMSECRFDRSVRSSSSV